jgi:hypothetical protein
LLSKKLAPESAAKLTRFHLPCQDKAPHMRDAYAEAMEPVDTLTLRRGFIEENLSSKLDG